MLLAALYAVGPVVEHSPLAAVVPCPNSATLDALVQSFTNVLNGCFSQDKLFWGFNYTPGPSAPPASAVIASLAQNSPALAIHGWNFDGTWAQGTSPTALANFTLGFTVEICPTGQPCSGNVPPVGCDQSGGCDLCARVGVPSRPPARACSTTHANGSGALHVVPFAR